MKQIVIIGSGPTGLVSALQLLRSGKKVVVLEKSDNFGGIAGKISKNGYIIDIGPHRFTPHNYEVKKYVEELMDKDILIRNQKSSIFWQDSWMTYPLSLVDILKNNSPLILVKIMFSYFIEVVKYGVFRKKIISYRDYTNYNFGSFLSDKLFCSIAEKTWKTSADKISADLAAQRISVDNLMKTGFNLLLNRKKKIDENLMPRKKFFYFKGGYYRLIDRMVEEIRKMGGEVINQANVIDIKTKGKKCTEVVYEKNKKQFNLESSWVIATNPLTQTANFLNINVKNNLHFRNLLIFALVINKNSITDDISLFFPEKEYPFGRIWEQKNYDPSMCKANETILGVEITCKTDDFYWKANDEEIYEKLIDVLSDLKLVKGKDVKTYFSARFSDVYPVYDLNFKKNIERIFKQTDQYDNLITNGRPGLFLYNNVHHSIEMGIMAADKVLGKDKRSWKKIRQFFNNYKIEE